MEINVYKIWKLPVPSQKQQNKEKEISEDLVF